MNIVDVLERFSDEGIKTGEDLNEFLRDLDMRGWDVDAIDYELLEIIDPSYEEDSYEEEEEE